MAIIKLGSQTEYIRQWGVRVPSPVGVAAAQVINPVEGMARGLMRAVVDGGGKLGELLARGYRDHQTERLEEESLRVEREFTEFRDAWTKENQGMAARDAGQVFAEKHEELAKEAAERLDVGEDEIYISELRKKMGYQNLYALRDGLQYAKAEENKYSKSVWDGQLASFQKMAEEHPEDGDALRAKCDELLQAWRRDNPGLDDTAMRMHLEEMAGTRRVETLIAQGRLSEARAALGESVSSAGYVGEPAMPGGARASSRGTGGQRGTSIAEMQCNPLNLKKVGHNGRSRNDFETFATDGDGFRAAWRQLKIYQNGKRKLKTPAEMIRTWAPAKDGNDLKKYFATVRSVGGIDVNAPIDINDPQAAARLIKAMAVMESPLGGRYSNEDVAAMLTEGKGVTRVTPLAANERPAGSGPIPASGQAGGGAGSGQAGNTQSSSPQIYTGSSFGISPLKNARYQRQIDQLEKQQAHAELVKFQQPLDDYFAKCAAGVVVDAPFTPAQIAARFGDAAPALIEKIEAEGTYALDVNAIKTMTAEEQTLLLESRKPEDGDDHYKERLDRYTRLSRAISENQKERADAPAYVMQTIPEVKAACETMLANLTPENFTNYLNVLKSSASVLGLPDPEKEKIFSGTVSQSLADHLAQSENPARTLQAFQTAAGRHYPQIMRELAPKMGVNAMLYASGIPDQAVRKLRDAAKNPKFREQAEAELNLKGPEKMNFDDALFEATEEIRATFYAAGNTEVPAAIMENTRFLAYQYQLGLGLDQDEAIERAAREVITSRYVIETSPSGSTYRIPKSNEIDADKIPEAIKKKLGSLDLDNINLRINPNLPDKYQRRAYRNLLLNNSSYITCEDESGVYIFIDSQPLTNKEGQPVIFKWEELS